jgi:hypothetical protein
VVLPARLVGVELRQPELPEHVTSAGEHSTGEGLVDGVDGANTPASWGVKLVVGVVI